MIDVTAVRLFLLIVTGWLDRRERDAIAYLVEENRLLHRKWARGACGSRTPTDDGWRRWPTGWAAVSCATSPRW